MKTLKGIMLRKAVLVPAISILGAATLWLTFSLIKALQPPPLFKPDSRFAIGVNYPELKYGIDFGANVRGDHEGVSTPETSKEVDADFAFLSSQGLNVVRWFMFCDGRGGLTFGPDGRVTGIDPYVLQDMRAALSIAHKHNIRIMFVLLDYNFAQPAVWMDGRKVGGHRKVVEDPQFTASFIDNALSPMLRSFGNSPDIAAWEIINEPEWVMTSLPGWNSSKIGVKKMQTFVATTGGFIKAHAKQPVTVGSASLSDLDYWDNCGLDFLQFHSYPYLEGKNPLDTPVSALGHQIPIVLGEFPTGDTTMSTDQYLDLMYKNGYVGALAWSYRASDKYSNLAKQLPAIEAWQKAHSQTSR